MKKTIVLIISIIMIISNFGMFGCGECEHDWQAATCTSPKTCKICGATEGSVLEHNWQAAICTAPKTCTKCGETEGISLGHDWQSATCTTPKTCTKCGETEGSSLGHNWQSATCTTPKTCKLCGETEGSSSGHDWKIATCTTPKTCKKCGETEGSSSGHDWKIATCTTPKTCTKCGETEGGLVGHDWEPATCRNPKTCKNCGKTEGAVDLYNEGSKIMDSTKIYDEAKLTVGEITVYNKNGSATALGTAFCIDKTGKFVTNYHVIDGCYSAEIVINNKTYEVVNVLAYDEDIDLAVLKVNGVFDQVSIYKGTVLGASIVYSIGSAEGLTLSFSSGVVSSPSRIIDSVEYVQHTSPISHGCSGGPLFSSYGNVIGINTSSMVEGQNINFAISINELDNLIYQTTTLQEIYEKNNPSTDTKTYFDPFEYIINEVESNDYFYLADRITINGTTVKGSINGANDADCFVFELAPYETIYIVGSFTYEIDAKGSISGIFNSNENAVAASEYNSSSGSISVFYKNTASYKRTFYFYIGFDEDYIYKNYVGEYYLWFVVE